jgi:hypothetical protein
VSLLFQQKKALDNKENEQKCRSIGLSGEDEKQNTHHTETQGQPNFTPQPKCALPILQRKGQGSHQDRA